MSHVLPEQAKARRLTYRGGRWYLEVSQLVGKSGVYHPQESYLRTPKAILDFLQDNASPDLAADTRSLLRSPPATDTSFEAANGTWVPHGALSNPPPSGSSKASKGGTELIELRAEVGRVKAICNELRLQLIRLEAEVAQVRGTAPHAIGKPPISRTAQPEATSLQREPVPASKLSPAVQPGPSAQPPQQAIPAVQPSAKTGTDDGPSVPQAPSQNTTDAAPTPLPGKPLTLPTADNVLHCMSQLLDKPLTSRPLKQAPLTGAERANWYVSALLDDHDQEIGAFVCTLEAAVRLGTTLMMLSEGAAQDQLKARTIDEGTLEATSEIFNTASSTFNEIQSNAHCRARPLQCLKDTDLVWIDHARAQVAMELDIGGTLLCLAR